MLYVALVGLCSLMSVVFSRLSWGMQSKGPGSTVLLAALSMLLAVSAPAMLFWRGSRPFLVTLIAAGVSTVFPIGNALPLVALACLVGRRRGPAVWWTTAVVAVSSLWVTVSDAVAQPRGASMLKAWLGPQPSDPSQNLDLPLHEVAVVYLVGLALAVGTGLLVRSRREARHAAAAEKVGRAATTRLEDEVARRQERERIAREVHDSLGHRLSLLNLHAGALEANTSDPRMAKSAQLVRESAAAAMDDLRSLLDLLRQPGESDLPPVPLSALAQVVRESYGAGQLISSSIYIQDPDDADPALTRAVYRIVQEVLTNARKHAPEEKVFLSVDGRPDAGITIDVRNRYVPRTVDEPRGSQRGLTGISERVEVLGGSMLCGIDGDDYRVHVELPWRPA